MIIVPELSLTKFGGQFHVSVTRNGVESPVEITKNLVVNEGLNSLLGQGLAQATQISNYYVALFSGNVTPASTWTAANFVSNATEFINYDESTRQAWTHGSVASQSIDNLASKAVFTISTGGGTVYGAALISVNTKSATTGTLIAATRFSAARTLIAADLLNIGYTISASSS